jgi:hypothetical protein
MPEKAIVCPSCGSTDLFVISTGVVFRGGVVLETLRWMEADEDVGEPHYHVEEQILEEPDPAETEGPVRALCSQCLTDLTARYLETDGGGPSS